MQAVGMLGTYISQGVYTVAGPFHPFGGAVDIIVVRQQDGSFKTSPWYVKFGKFQGVLKSREKIVDIAVNDVPTDFHMYLDRTGEAYFLKDPDPDEPDTVLSPPSAASSGDEVVDYKKRRPLSPQLMKSVSESAVIKQGFEIPEKYDLAEIAVPETSSDEKVANSTSPAAASSLADGSPPKQLDAAVVERPKTGKRNPKPPRSLLALMFGSKSSGSSGVLSSSETDKAAAETNLEKQNSIGRAEMVADLLESRWSIGERDFLPIDLTEAQHPEEVHDDLPVLKTLHPVGSLKKDEMQESALSIEPCNKLLGEAQSSLAEDLPHSSVERQDEMVLSPRELMVNVDDDGSKKAGDNSNYYHVGLDVTDFMAESSLVQTTDTSNTEMIIMSYDAHLLSAPVLSDNQQYLKKESGQESLMAIHSACTSGNYEVSSIIHQVISQPANDYKVGCEFTTINESPELPDGSANLLHVKSIIEPDTFRVSPILRTTDRPHLIDEGCDVVLQHKTLSFGKSVEPAMTTLESPCAFSEDSHTPLQPVASVEVLLGDSDLVHKKQNISEVISQDSRQIVTDKDESAWDLAPFRLSQKEIQEVDFTDSACIPEIHSSGSSYRVPLSISKPSTGFYGFDEGDSSKPHGLYMESFQVVNFTEPEMISDVIGDMKSTGTQFSKTSSSDSLGSDERSIFESPSPVVSALDLSPTSGSCEPVIFDGAGQQHDAAEPAYPDCKPEILQEFVVSVDPLAERCDCRNNDFKVGYNSMGGNDDSCAAEQVWQKGSFASCPATGMASTGGGEVDQVVGDLESALHVKELEHFYSFKDIDTSVVNLEFNNGISWNCQMVKDFCCSTDNENGLNISGACDVRVETNALLGSTDSRISESEYLFVESHGGESREPEVEPLIVRSNPILIPRISNQDIESEVQTYNRCIPGSLPIHLSETVDLKDKYFCSHSVGSLPFSNMDASHNHATNDKYVLSRSDTEGDKPCNTIEELDTGSSKHTMLDTPGNENDTVGGSNTGVEISLCRHLLTEGMGAESAAKAFSAEKVSYDVFRLSGQDIFANDRLVVKIGERYFPWVAAAPLVLGKMAFGMEVPQDAMGAINVETPDSEAIKVGETGNNALVPSSGGWRLWPFPFRRSRNSKKDNLPSLPSKAMVAVAEVALRSTLTEELLEKNTYYSRPRRPKVRSYVPTSEQLASLNLKEGPNKVTFTFFTRVLGKQQVDARIYLWKWNTRIVISDVDGTITKSDVLGQFMPLVGKDWTQSGVTRLFSGIKENGYELLFLSARAIAQAYLTRQFLLNLKQDGETLPDGPVVISPDGLFPSLYREVIRRAPHEFKISCLEAIRELFPMDVNPFYAGFGNRETDEISYLKVGIPKGKIFIINARGEVVVNHRVDMRSYTSLHSLVDDMFPPISPEIAQIKDLLMVQEDFNSWNFWKMPLPEIDIELNETSKNQSTKKVGDSRK